MTEQQIKLKLEEAEQKHHERLNNAPNDMSYLEFEAYMNVTQKEVSSLSRMYRFVKTPTYSNDKIEGDLMTLTEWKACVRAGGFIDYDGFGYYVNDGKESDIVVIPSDLKHNQIRNEFSHVAWYNR